MFNFSIEQYLTTKADMMFNGILEIQASLKMKFAHKTEKKVSCGKNTKKLLDMLKNVR